MSLAKNLKALTELAPRPIVTWDKHQRIVRNKEIWDNKESVVHRLPRHYQERYWREHVLADRAPVHYQPPEKRFYWDAKRLVEVETENYPILPLHCPEMDQGLWGGEGVVKGYYESKPFTRKKVLPRQWIPKFWWPHVERAIVYSEVLDKYLNVIVTPRALRLIDESFGLDYYLLGTPEIDICSKLGLRLKREILIRLAKGDFYQDEPERRAYIQEKYEKFALPLEEAEWVGLDLNEACRKLQDIEDNTKPEPLKSVFERELWQALIDGRASYLEEEEKPQESVFEKMVEGAKAAKRIGNQKIPLFKD